MNVYEVGTEAGVVRIHVLVAPGAISTATAHTEPSPLNERSFHTGKPGDVKLITARAADSGMNRSNSPMVVAVRFVIV